jgi:outer membrane protein assembly factor BamA
LKKYVFIFFLLCVGKVYAQENTRPDFNTWSSIAIDYKASSKLSLELQEQLRLKENSQTIDSYFTQLSVEYELLKNFELGLGLRFEKNNDNKGKIQGYENRFRYNLDAVYGYKLRRFSLKHRIRYQNRMDLDETDALAKQQVRFKTGAGYNFPKWKLDPEVAVELFYPLNDLEKSGLNKFRLTLGTDYKMGDFGKLKAFFRIERSGNLEADSANILGVGYSYTIKNKK